MPRPDWPTAAPYVPATASRGVLMPLGDRQALATLHPSAVLRSDDREAARAGLVSDLRVAAGALA